MGVQLKRIDRHNYDIIVHASGIVEYCVPLNGYCYSLEELQKIVGGFIQIISPEGPNNMIVDEEGKLKEKKYNNYATNWCKSRKAIPENDFIVGDVLIVDKERIM